MTSSARGGITATMVAIVTVAAIGTSAMAQTNRGSATGATVGATAPSNGTTAPATGATMSPGATAPQSRSTPTTAPPSGRGLERGATTSNAASPARSDALSGAEGSSLSGVPALGGVTPNRAELPASAFGKLDAGNRGYVTLDDVRQLQGFESAFRQADQNGDGRLNLSEFNTAWGLYTGNVR
jgi:hypothetical protein